MLFGSFELNNVRTYNQTDIRCQQAIGHGNWLTGGQTGASAAVIAGSAYHSEVVKAASRSVLQCPLLLV
jgi:hypothetical protein